MSKQCRPSNDNTIMFVYGVSCIIAVIVIGTLRLVENKPSWDLLWACLFALAQGCTFIHLSYKDVFKPKENCSCLPPDPSPSVPPERDEG